MKPMCCVIIAAEQTSTTSAASWPRGAATERRHAGFISLISRYLFPWGSVVTTIVAGEHTERCRSTNRKAVLRRFELDVDKGLAYFERDCWGYARARELRDGNTGLNAQVRGAASAAPRGGSGLGVGKQAAGGCVQRERAVGCKWVFFLAPYIAELEERPVVSLLGLIPVAWRSIGSAQPLL